MTNLYDVFKTWVENNGLNVHKTMNKRDFKKYLSKKINKQGSISDKKIYGYRLRND